MTIEKFPAGSYVELISLQKDGTKKVRARCVLLENGGVECSGEEALVTELQIGISIVMPVAITVTPKDGISFLKALGSHFTSPYLFATDIILP